MEMHANQPCTPKQYLNWFYLTPGRLIVILLFVEGILLLSEQFQCSAFNQHKGLTVLSSVAILGGFLIVLIFWYIASLIVRWRFQFSIRSLLLLTLAVAIPSSWLAVEMQKARENADIVESITKLGGKIGYEYDICIDGKLIHFAETYAPAWLRQALGDDFFSDITSIIISGSHANDQNIQKLKGLKCVRNLELSNTMISDNGLKVIDQMTRLKWLDIHGNNITDNALINIEALHKLKSLNLSQTKITKDGIKHLDGLPQLSKISFFQTNIAGVKLHSLKTLRNLDLRETQIGDSELQYIKGMNQLVKLNLGGNNITDEGLKHLAELNGLQSLNLANNHVSDSGLKYLEGLQQLLWLDLSKNQVTESGISKLIGKFNKLMITHDKYE
jgi:Leucine-rich repeat (LRR) protein